MRLHIAQRVFYWMMRHVDGFDQWVIPFVLQLMRTVELNRNKRLIEKGESEE